MRRIRHCCDVVVRLETFPDFEENPLCKEYHGKHYKHPLVISWARNLYISLCLLEEV